VEQYQRYSSTKTINKLKQNNQLKENYLMFHVHSRDYDTVSVLFSLFLFSLVKFFVC
jgi:hypothetical protein